VVADSGLYSNHNATAMEEQQIDSYIQTLIGAAALNKEGPAKGRANAPEIRD
jgi:hypothetical protein